MEAQKETIREYLYRQSGVSREVLSEREIAEQFDIKRNHVHELLLELVGEGVVERYPRSGYRYVDYRATSAESAIVMRYLIELEAASAAVDRADREDEVRIVLANDALRKAAAAADLTAYTAADREFHTVLVRASHDNMLIRLFDFLQSTLFRQLPRAFSQPDRITQQGHEAITRAFLDRNGTKLRILLKRHLGYRQLKHRLETLAAPIPPDREIFDMLKSEAENAAADLFTEKSKNTERISSNRIRTKRKKQ